MVGKASLIVILGFSTLFLMVGENFSSITSRATENYIDYHLETISHTIAVSGANIAAHALYNDPGYNDDLHNIPFQGGLLDVDVDGYKITAVGTYRDNKDTVEVLVAPDKFSKYGYFSMYEKDSPTGTPIWWTGNDTVWGPFHTQDYLRCARHPTFIGDVSHLKSIKYYESFYKDRPKILGDYNPGHSVEIPMGSVDDMETAAINDGLVFSGHDTVYLTFDLDSLRYKFRHDTSYVAIPLADSVPNGLIFAQNSIVRLQGTVRGQYTVACSSPGSGPTVNKSRGTIYLDDNIVYETDPRTNPDATDLLGIVAENYVWITNNSANNQSIDIHGAVFSETEGFGAEAYNTRPVAGSINLLGGITQYYRKQVGTFSGSSITHGFAKKYRYDERLRTKMFPPYFPGTGGFEIVYWLE